MSVPTVNIEPIATASGVPTYDEQNRESADANQENTMEHVNRIIADEETDQSPEVKGQDETNVDDISPEERQRQAEMPRNPKKRMWEENVEGQKEGGKDEL